MHEILEARCSRGNVEERRTEDLEVYGKCIKMET